MTRGTSVRYLFVSVEQLEHAGVRRDGLARWWVNDLGLAYRGRVLVPEDWTAQQIADKLDLLAKRTSEGVAKARLYGPLRLHEEYEVRSRQ